jgi:Na+/melibiose symporter-like transporter
MTFFFNFKWIGISFIASFLVFFLFVRITYLELTLAILFSILFGGLVVDHPGNPENVAKIAPILLLFCIAAPICISPLYLLDWGEKWQSWPIPTVVAEVLVFFVIIIYHGFQRKIIKHGKE